MYHLNGYDYKTSQNQFRRIAKGAPPGDPNKIALMISSFSNVVGLKLEGVLALAVRLRGFYPQVVELSPDNWVRRYHHLFDNNRFIDFQRILVTEPPVVPDSKILEFKRSQPTIQDLFRLTYRQIDIGRISLSNVLYRHKFSKFDL